MQISGCMFLFLKLCVYVLATFVMPEHAVLNMCILC